MSRLSIAMAKENQALSKSLKAKSKQKKPYRERESSSASTSNENEASSSGTSNGEPSSTTSSGAKSSSGTAASSSLSAWAVSEIQGMMHGFGDCSKPLLESAKLIEEIVGQQMTSLFTQAADLATACGAKYVGVEDVLFLMRKDKAKLGRLIRYMELKCFQSSVLSKTPSDDEASAVADLVTPETANGDTKSATTPLVKRTKLCRDFVTSIDQTGELIALFADSLFDEVKKERDQRAEIQTRCMNQAQYLEYCNARSSSFCRKNKTAKFREWLMMHFDSDIKPNAPVIEIFNYLAYETVAQVVDLALLVKKEGRNVPGDPMTWSMPPIMCNPGFPSVQFLNVQERRSTESLTKNEACSASIAEMDCVTPDEIREAIRRYWNHRGPLACFMKQQYACPGKRLLTC